MWTKPKSIYRMYVFERLNVNKFPTIWYFQNRDESGKRDYLYYLAIGNARIKEYQEALKFLRALLQVEPGKSTVAACRLDISI